jgi:pyruvate/2-oxoglutarate dehydrogenase complex dihydrolipoamide dehydrogenase (E3) component
LRTPIEIKNKVIKAIKEGHAKDADYYYRKIPFEWFKSVLKFHPKKVEEENTLKSLKAKNTLVATGTSPRKKDAVCRWRRHFLPLKKSLNWLKFALAILIPVRLKSH